MRRVAHGTLYISDPQVTERLLHLMKVQASAVRSAYQFMRESGDDDTSTGNLVKQHLKPHYMKDLNQRYISDACGIAAQIKDKPSVIFGGKRSWKEFQEGKLSKTEWQNKRNSQLYSRGDKSHSGNPNIQVSADCKTILINDPSKYKLWLEGKLYLPKKFKPDLSCYDVRILRRSQKNNTFQIKISWDEQDCPVITNPISQGAIGLDCNPDGIAVVETDFSGNLIHHHYESEQRIQFARKNKRDNDVRLLAVRIVDLAVQLKKPIVLEKLEFKKKNKKKQYKKFNRMKHNFLHKKLLDAVKSRSIRKGVEIVGTQPAFTSVLGKLKYQDKYSLNRHTAAGLVIARRGMGIDQEKQTFTDTLIGRNGSRVKLEAGSQEHTLSLKAWSWLRNKFLKPKNSLPHRDATNLAEVSDKPTFGNIGIGGSLGETPKGESPIIITGRRGDNFPGLVSGVPEYLSLEVISKGDEKAPWEVFITS